MANDTNWPDLIFALCWGAFWFLVWGAVAIGGLIIFLGAVKWAWSIL